MEIVDIAVNNLVPYDKNPRRNDEAAVKVAESIKQFGFKIPLVVDRNNVVVCGHTRLKAAKKLKLKTVPCILADDLSEDQIKAFRLVDNRTAEIAEWDFALLEEELADVQLDMTAFDFDDLLPLSSYIPCRAWNLTSPVRLPYAVPLSEIGLARPPQSWQYLTEEQAALLR